MMNVVPDGERLDASESLILEPPRQNHVCHQYLIIDSFTAAKIIHTWNPTLVLAGAKTTFPHSRTALTKPS
jgi:hypothetical protein